MSIDEEHEVKSIIDRIDAMGTGRSLGEGESSGLGERRRPSIFDGLGQGSTEHLVDVRSERADSRQINGLVGKGKERETGLEEAEEGDRDDEPAPEMERSITDEEGLGWPGKTVDDLWSHESA